MYCPNPECPSLRELGTVAEFQEDVAVCSECGTRLCPGEAPRASDPHDPPPTAEEYAPQPEAIPFETVGSYPTWLLANVARSALEAAGIQVLVAGESAIEGVYAGAFPSGGVMLQVPQDQAAQAREILGRDLSTDREIFGEDAGSAREEKTCPRCGSASHSLLALSWLEKLGVALIGDLHIGRRAVKCDSCGQVWRLARAEKNT